jgi:hypothetical protein
MLGLGRYYPCRRCQRVSSPVQRLAYQTAFLIQGKSSPTEKKTVRGWIWDHFETSWATWFTIRLDSPNSADGYSAHGIIAHYIKKQLGLEVEMDNRQYC